MKKAVASTKGYFGVRGMTGKLEADELERTDKNGITRREALLRVRVRSC